MSFFHSYIYLYINIHAVYRYIYENPQVTQKCFFFPHNKAWWQWLHIYTERCCCCSCSCCWMSGRRAAHVYLHDVGVKQMAGMWARIAQCVRGASWGGGLKKEKKKWKIESLVWASFWRAQKWRSLASLQIYPHIGGATAARLTYYFLLRFLIQIIGMISCTLYWYGTTL